MTYKLRTWLSYPCPHTHALKARHTKRISTGVGFDVPCSVFLGTKNQFSHSLWTRPLVAIIEWTVAECFSHLEMLAPNNRTFVIHLTLDRTHYSLLRTTIYRLLWKLALAARRALSTEYNFDSNCAVNCIKRCIQLFVRPKRAQKHPVGFGFARECVHAPDKAPLIGHVPLHLRRLVCAANFNCSLWNSIMCH